MPTRIRRLLADLTPEARREVEDFAQFLARRRGRRRSRHLRQDWAGGLRDARETFTALELQKKALDWRGD